MPPIRPSKPGESNLRSEGHGFESNHGHQGQKCQPGGLGTCRIEDMGRELAKPDMRALSDRFKPAQRFCACARRATSGPREQSVKPLKSELDHPDQQGSPSQCDQNRRSKDHCGPSGSGVVVPRWFERCSILVQHGSCPPCWPFGCMQQAKPLPLHGSRGVNRTGRAAQVVDALWQASFSIWRDACDRTNRGGAS